MNTKILDQLEFNKVKDQFTEYLQTEQAQVELRDLVPMTNSERIQNQFTEIQEMTEIFVEHHGFAIGSLRDISEPLRRLELDADLNIQELIAIKKVLQASADLGRFYADLENVELVALKRLFEKIEAFPSLQGSLQSINDGGFIEHFASPELQNIRRQLKSCDDAIRQTLQDILKKSGHMLAESLIASRNGRSVLPVKNTYRNRIAGVVHDISSSGNTLVASTLTLKMLSSSLLNVFSKRLRPSQVYKAAFKVSMMVVSLNILLALSCRISVVNSNLAMMPFARPCKTFSRNLVTCWLRV